MRTFRIGWTWEGWVWEAWLERPRASTDSFCDGVEHMIFPGGQWPVWTMVTKHWNNAVEVERSVAEMAFACTKWLVIASLNRYIATAIRWPVLTSYCSAHGNGRLQGPCTGKAWSLVGNIGALSSLARLLSSWTHSPKNHCEVHSYTLTYFCPDSAVK